ncbi:MAG: type II secretion system protein M [Steroidobacter sp.]
MYRSNQPSRTNSKVMSQSFNEQFEQLKSRFMALQPRERMIVSISAVLLLLVTIYSLVLSPLYKSVNERSAHVVQKQQDLAWMQSMAPQLRALGISKPVSNPGESMVVVIASSAGRANIASSIAGQTPVGNNSVRVRLENVQFDSLVVWLGMLQSDFGINVDAADIAHGAQPGQVKAGLTLTRTGS